MMMFTSALLVLLPVLSAHPTAFPNRQHPRDRTQTLQRRYTPPSPKLHQVESFWSVNSDSYHRLTNLLPTILDKAIATSTHSWEIGALTQALLEVYDPALAPFEFSGSGFGNSTPDAFIQVTKAAIDSYDWSGSPSSTRPSLLGNLKDYVWTATSPAPLQGKPLVNGDGSLGDPASLAPAVWILGQLAKRKDVREQYGLRSSDDYAWAVGGQLKYVLEGSRSSNGTVSMREANFQVWSDMGYMIPPFASYLGLTAQNHDLLTIALDQFTLESSALYDPSTQLYRHINDFDARPWATGNGWMAMGLMRVLASTFAAGEAGVQWDKVGPLEQEIAGVFKSLLSQLDENDLIPNYMLETEERLSHGDSAGTALIVAAFYRFKMIAPWLVDDDMKAKGERAFDGVMKKVTDEGWLTQVVDPLGSNGFLVYIENTTMRSPEGQSFLAMMWAARTAAAC